MNTAAILKEKFGYDSFRPGQALIVDAILNKRDCLAIMPTGAGKSLCFQVPALLLDGITLVISPLISLMKDQVDALRQNGLPVAYINSSLSAAQVNATLERAGNNAYKIIYVAPERLETPDFQAFSSHADISMVAVDEAHCVSHWGQDFRPSYLNISTFVEGLRERPVVSAFTATATDLVKEDIVRLLNLNAPVVHASGFNRENLYFEVRHPGDKFAELADYLEKNPGKSGIIYCATRKIVEEVVDRLNSAGVKASGYHAGMGQGERTAVQQDFAHDRNPVIVATNAFGMGIDKSNVSFVVHYNMPKNMESYYQEAGRAGRDGSPADCILLYSRKDIMLNQFLIEKTDSETAQEDAKAKDYRRLRQIETYCNTTDCLRQYILNYFGDTDKCECNNCGNCGAEKELTDITTDAQKILSCIHRMRGRWGLAKIVQVLRGKAKTLNELPTYGLMPGQSEERIREMIYFLIQKGYAESIGDKYPTVQTTQAAWEVLKGETIVKMPLGVLQEAKEPPAERRKKARKFKQSNQPAYAVNDELFAVLKALRLNLATAENVPAFVIFSDATLYDMCMKLPSADDEFLNVSGVGKIKLNKYGTVFMEEIQKFKSSGEEILPLDCTDKPSLAGLIKRPVL